MTLTTSSEAETRELGRLLGPLLQPDDVVSLSGDLGAGKTVLVKGVAEGLGVREVVSSPTFNILLVHPGRLVLNHVDLYRLESPEQVEDIDLYGVMESGGVTIVEWGERFGGTLPPDHLVVTLLIEDEEVRSILLEPGGPRAKALAAAWEAAWTLWKGAEPR